MERNRILTLHFIDGSNIVFSFPEQNTNAMAKKLMLADVMTNNQLMIEADGGLLVFPMSSVKYIQLSGLGLSEFDGAQLPRMIIRNATIVN